MTRRDWWLSVLAVCMMIGIFALQLRGQVLRDPGTFSCDLWLKTRASDKDIFNPFTISVTAWVQGYVTGALDLGIAIRGDVPASLRDALDDGYNATMKFRDADGIPKGIDAYCAAHPNEMNVGAMSLDMILKAYGLDPPIGASADAAAAAARRKK